MLRSKPTCIALTEDDLCYHIDSIFSRNEQLTRWHQQRTGSGNSYDGDDDEDGLFLDSDSFSLPETSFESECDEAQSQIMAGDSPRETEEQTDNAPQALASTVARYSPHQHVIQSAGDTHSLHNSLQLARPSSQHNHSLASPNQALPQPPDDTDDTSILTRLLANLFLELTGHMCTIKELANSRKISPNSQDPSLWTELNIKGSSNTKPLKHPPSHLSRLQLIPQKSVPSSLHRMEYPHHTKLASDKEPLEAGFNEITAFETEVQEFLAEVASDEGSTALQLSSLQGSPNCSIKRCEALPNEMAINSSWDEDTKDIGHFRYQNTISRATQTDEDLIESDDKEDGILNQPRSQENIAPGIMTGQLPSNRPLQDPFISAMFPESGAPVHDTTDQYRRSVEGFVKKPSKRGRAARNPDGVVLSSSRYSENTANFLSKLGHLVHPTMVDATVFQEYVEKLTSELDRAP